MTPRSAVRDEAGQVTVLIVGFVLVLVTLVAVVVDASAAFLHRQALNSLADAAALAATDGIQGEYVYTHGLGQRAEIDPWAAQRYAEDYLASSRARTRYPGLRTWITTTHNTVVVRLRAPVDLPLQVPDVGPSPVITGTAASVVIITD